MSTALRKLDKLTAAKRHFLSAPDGISTAQLAARLNISLVTAHRYINELDCLQPSPHRYTLEPSQEDIEFATAVLWRAGKIKKDAP